MWSGYVSHSVRKISSTDFWNCNASSELSTAKHYRNHFSEKTMTCLWPTNYGFTMVYIQCLLGVEGEIGTKL